MKTIIVYSGYNMRAVIAFLRTLKIWRLPFLIIARSAEDPVFLTEYNDKVVAVRENTTLDWASMGATLREVLARAPAEGYLVAPSSEALNRFLLEHRSQLDDMGIELPLCERSLYLKISEKLSFVEMCVAQGIHVPAEHASLSSAPLPLVAKPKSYRSKATGEYLKPVLIPDRNEQDDFIRQRQEEDYFFQEWVAGSSYYFLAYFFRTDRSPLLFSQENFIQQASGGSILAARASDIHQTELVRPYIELLKNEKFHGLIMIEVKGGRDDVKMIEANPRFWGPSQLFVDAGINFFQALLWDYGFEVPLPNEGNVTGWSTCGNTRYFWDDGLSFNPANIDGVTFHNYRKDMLKKDYPVWNCANLFCRSDTRKLYDRYFMNSQFFNKSRLEELKEKYNQNSKHSAYQVLPPLLVPLLSQNVLCTKSRQEESRFHFMNESLDFEGKSVLDIGGNTGFFTFESLRHGAAIDYFEGNRVHAEFVEIARDVIGVRDRLNVHKRYYDFEATPSQPYDVVLLLNVLHHVGDDFGDPSISREKALDLIITFLKTIASTARHLVLQLGFNWKGDRNLPLFDTGTKAEMISFVRKHLYEYYDFVRTAVPEVINEEIVYVDVDNRNILRRDDLGEFLNRPLFIMQSKKIVNFDF